jgi:hypothetical protein
MYDMFSNDRSVVVRRIAGAIALSVLAVLVTGCDESDSRDIKLSHKAHIEKRGMECVDCHEGAEDTDTPGMPDEKLCMTCHAKLDKEMKGKGTPPTEKCLYCHNPKKEQLYRGAKVVMGPGPSGELLSSHAKHAEKEVACAACHGDVAKDDNLLMPRRRYMPAAETCIDCHEERKVSAECATCHKSRRRESAPESHKVSWLTVHGLEADSASGIHGRDCTTCHARKECRECHTSQAPRDHTGFWRLKGHGIGASMNRERCLTCHRQDYCVQCHLDGAPPRPAVHPTSDCRRCHAVFGRGHRVPMTDNCTVCHK